MKRRVMGAAIVGALTAVTLAGAATPAFADTGNPLDIGPVIAGIAPKDYPKKYVGYYARPDATNWGWGEQVVPIGLANGRGQNSNPAAIARGCFPAASEAYVPDVGTISPTRGEFCRLHPGSVIFNVGTAHRAKNRDGKRHSTSGRSLFIRYSRTADCLTPTVSGPGETGLDMRGLGLDVSRGIGDNETQITRQIPSDKVGLYMCIAQGFYSDQLDPSSIPVVGVDEGYAWTVRGPWTSYQIVATDRNYVPTQVVATPGDAQAVVTWNYDNNELAGTEFTAASNPGGKQCTTVGTKTCTVTGLTNGTAYTFTVTAKRPFMTFASEPSAAVTPVGANAGGNAGGNAANAQPLGASRVIVTPVNSNDVKPLGAVEVTAPLSGALAADQRITNRYVLACFVAARGDACGDERRRIELRPVIDLQKVRVWIPSSAAGKFLRLTQTVTTTTTAPSSPAVFTVITKQPAVGQALVDPPAGADPNAAAPQQVGEVAAVPAPNAQGGAGAQNQAGAAPAEQAASPAAVDAGALGALAAAARVNLEVAPIVNTEGEGANGAQSLSLSIPGVQTKNRKIPLSATVAPATAGTVTFTLTRVTPKGKWIVGKVKAATVNAKGKASAKWVLETKKPSGAYTVVASFVPKEKGKAGVTVTKAITVK